MCVMNSSPKSWKADLELHSNFHFSHDQSQLVPQVISMYHHCEIDWLRVKMPFVLLFGADHSSFDIIHICNSEVILGLMSVAFF